MPDYPDPVPTTVGTVIPEVVHFLTPPGGMDAASTLYRLPPNVAALAYNCVPFKESWRVRAGTARVGDTTTSTLLHARNFTTSSGQIWTVQWTDTGVQWLDGTTWRAMTGPALTGDEASIIAETAWGDLLIFSNGRDGMHAIDFTTKTYTAITNTPSACHLSTFNRRVIASVVNTGRIQWCTAGNYLDWTSTNLGAGYEDLLSSEASTGAETQTAVIPVSDEIAYAIRSGSVWQVVPTRQVGNPFAFSRLEGDSGSRWPHACCTVPGGAAFMSDIGVFVVRGGQVSDISAPLALLWKESDGPAASGLTRLTQEQLRRCCMIYSVIDDSLFLSVPIQSEFTTAQTYVFRFGLSTGLWSFDDYGWPIKSMAAASHRSSATIGEFGAAATIGDFSPVGVVGDLGVSAYVHGVIFTKGYHTASATRFIARHAPELSRDTNTCEVMPDGTSGPMNFAVDLHTPVIRAADPMGVAHLHDVTLIYLVSEKTSGADMTYSLSAFSENTTLFTTGTLALPAVSGRYRLKSITVPVNRQAKQIWLAILFQKPCELRLLDVVARVSNGAVMSQTALP